MCYHEYYDWGYCVILEAFFACLSLLSCIRSQEEAPKANDGESIAVARGLLCEPPGFHMPRGTFAGRQHLSSIRAS